MLGGVLLVGLLVDAMGRRTHLPGVTLLMLLGLAVGPPGFDLMPEQVIAWFPLVGTAALSMIGFVMGHEFTRDAMGVRGRAVLVVSAAVTVATALVVALGLVAWGVPPGSAVLLGTIATATAPAAVLAVLGELRAHGPLSELLRGVVAVDDVWGLSMFSLALGLAAWWAEGVGVLAAMGAGLWELGGGLALGVVLGLPMAALTGRLSPGEPTRLEALGFVLLVGGLGRMLGVSYLLAAVTMGAVVANLATHHERPFDEIEQLDRPFLITFFLLAGASLDLQALSGVGSTVVAYVLLRVVGRLVGAALGLRFAGRTDGGGVGLGLALLPQAGVALGLALLAVDRIPSVGREILPIVVAATVVFELIGPPLTRTAVVRAGEAGHVPG